MAIALVGSASQAGASVTATTATVTVPTGSTGDLILVYAAAGSNATSGANAPVVSAPSANLIKVNDMHTIFCGAALFYRFVQAGDPATYVINISSAAVLAVTCVRYSGVSALRSWNLLASTDVAGTIPTSFTLPTSENVQPTDLVIASMAYGRGIKTTTIAAVNTPAGWTQRVTLTGPTASTAFPLTAAMYERLGATDTPAFTGSGGHWVGSALVLVDSATPVPDATGAFPTFVAAATAVTSATGLKTITVNKPAGVLDGHLLLLAVLSADGINTFTAPAGWRALGLGTIGFGAGTATNAVDGNAQLWYKIAAGEGGSYTITATGTQEITAVIVAYTGVRNPSPVSLTGTVCQISSAVAAGSTSPAPYANPGVSADELVVNFYCSGADATGTYTVTGPSGTWTQRAQAISAVAADYNAGITVAEKLGAVDYPTAVAGASKVVGWVIFSVVVDGAAAPRHSTGLAFF